MFKLHKMSLKLSNCSTNYKKHLTVEKTKKNGNLISKPFPIKRVATIIF